MRRTRTEGGWESTIDLPSADTALLPTALRAPSASLRATRLTYGADGTARAYSADGRVVWSSALAARTVAERDGRGAAAAAPATAAGVDRHGVERMLAGSVAAPGRYAAMRAALLHAFDVSSSGVTTETFVRSHGDTIVTVVADRSTGGLREIRTIVGGRDVHVVRMTYARLDDSTYFRTGLQTEVAPRPGVPARAIVVSLANVHLRRLGGTHVVRVQ